MSKSAKFYGIDISKEVFDVMAQEEPFYQFTNDLVGFKKFLKYWMAKVIAL